MAAILLKKLKDSTFHQPREEKFFFFSGGLLKGGSSKVVLLVRTKNMPSAGGKRVARTGTLTLFSNTNNTNRPLEAIPLRESSFII